MYMPCDGLVPVLYYHHLVICMSAADCGLHMLHMYSTQLLRGRASSLGSYIRGGKQGLRRRQDFRALQSRAEVAPKLHKRCTIFVVPEAVF